MRFLATLVLAFSILFAGGCNHNVVAPIPGSVNQFDSDTYLTLSTAKGAIDKAKTELANGAFSNATVADDVKKAINAAVTAYNTADVTYQSYHTAAVSGSATPAQQAEVSRTLSNLNTTVVNITTAKGGK
jgi:hypothetical protein